MDYKIEKELCISQLAEKINKIGEVNIRNIKTQVDSFYGVNSFDDNRKREVVQARQVTWWLAKKLTRLSLAAMGEPFGKDHATVLHGIKTVNNLAETNKNFKIELNQLLSKWNKS